MKVRCEPSSNNMLGPIDPWREMIGAIAVFRKTNGDGVIDALITTSLESIS